jgi:non-ribosomal peptide synthetase component F
VAAILATLKAGATYVPLDRRSRQVASHGLAETHATVLLTQPHLTNRLPAPRPW